MSALIGAILANAGEARSTRRLAIVPDFTFTATGMAAELCGYEVVLANCGAATWTFEPGDLLKQPNLLKRVGLVVPVAAFGRAIDQTRWLEFQRQTGIAVVIDAAASFDQFAARPTLAFGALPVVLSFHATKCFSTGEGGCVVATDADLARSVTQFLNFGFMGSRNSAALGINGKMSEYAAAVGLAELDGWSAKHLGFQRVIAEYRRAFESENIGARLWGAPDVSASYVLLQCKSAREADSVVKTLSAEGIGSRLWYGAGLSSHDHFRTARRLVSEKASGLRPRTVVGLPVAPDLRRADIQRICHSVSRALT